MMNVENAINRLSEHFALLIEREWPDDVRQAFQPVLQGRAALVRSERQVVIAGGLRAGKTTLINAMLGMDILPTRVYGATGVLTRIRHGAELGARVQRRREDGVLEETPVASDALAPYLLLDDSGETMRPPAGVEEVVLTCPSALLEPQGVLIDMPDLIDFPELAERCWHEIGQADLAVLVLSASQLLGDDEKALAHEIDTALGGNIVFVVNRMDGLAPQEREQVLNWALTTLEGVGNGQVGSPRIFSASALQALRAQADDAPASEEAKQSLVWLKELTSWLSDILRHPVGAQVCLVARTTQLARRLCTLRAWLETAQATAQDHLQEAIALDERAADTARDAFVSSVAEVRGGLRKIAQLLPKQTEEWVEGQLRRAAALLEAGDDWEVKAERAITDGRANYRDQVIRAGARSASKLKGALPWAKPAWKGPAADVDIVPAGDGAGNTAAVAVGIFGGLLLGPIGALGGAGLGKLLFGGDMKAENLKQIEAVVRKEAAALETEARRYLAAAEIDLNVWAERTTLTQAPSSAQTIARADLERCDELIAWCDKAISLIEAAHQAALGADDA